MIYVYVYIYIYIYLCYPQPPSKIYAFCSLLCFSGSVYHASDLVRLLTHTYMLPPQTPIDSCNFHLSAAAAAATTTTAPTTAIKMVTPNPGPTSTM